MHLPSANVYIVQEVKINGGPKAGWDDLARAMHFYERPDYIFMLTMDEALIMFPESKPWR